MDAGAALAISDASGDQGFLPDELTKCPLTHLVNAMVIAFYYSVVSMPFEYQDPVANAAFLSFMKGLKAARESALEQQGMAPAKVAPITTDQLSFLAECRKQFEEADGKSEKLREIYLNIRPEFSETALENLAESTSSFTIPERSQTH